MTAKGKKLKDAIAARQATFKEQTVAIDDHWSIVRIDEYNWQIKTTIPAYKQYKNYYYSKMEHALRALPSLMLQEEAKTDLKAILGGLDSVRDRLDQAISDAKLIVALHEEGRKS